MTAGLTRTGRVTIRDWWDWYVTLAENDDAPIALVAGPGLPDVDPADDEQLRVELAAPYQT